MPTTPYRPAEGLVAYTIPDPDYPRARRHYTIFDHDPCDDVDFLETVFMDDSSLMDLDTEFIR
jgi:hypothetical protein